MVAGRQSFAGLVISQGKMDKTIKVRVQRVKFNRQVQKDIVHYKDFLVHDEANKCKEGDVVQIEYFQKISRRKAFAVTQIMKNKGTEWLQYQQEAPATVAREEIANMERYQKERAQRMAGVNPVVQDLRAIEEAEFKGENEKVQQLKEKYGLTTWPPTHEIVGLDYQELKKSLKDLDIEIQKREYGDYVKSLMSTNPDKCKQILESMGRGDVTKPQMMKNILMTHYARKFNAL